MGAGETRGEAIEKIRKASGAYSLACALPAFG